MSGWARSGLPGLVAPEELPNYPKFQPLYTSDFETESIQLKFWYKGLYYKDPGVLFCIEALAGNEKSDQDGIVITASSNKIGIGIISQLIYIVDSLLNEWYPSVKSSSIKQQIECPECVKQGRGDPFLFNRNDCLSNILQRKSSIECAYNQDDRHRNHSVPLKDVVPDLFLEDIEPKILLPFYSIRCSDYHLGEGGYGNVYKGVLLTNGKEVAIKKFISKQTSRKERALYELTKEARMLCQLHHPCLISLQGVCTHPDMMALILELAPQNSITFALLKNWTKTIERITIYRIAVQVASALRYLHSKSIIFRDLKADNVLLWTTDLNSLCHCKITDFGVASYMTPVGVKGLVGSRGFKAPEVLNFCHYLRDGSVYSYKADVFSFGMFLFQLIARKFPFESTCADALVSAGERPKIHGVKEARHSFHYLTQLMQLCWKQDPNHRPEMNEIIESLCLSEMQVVMCVFPIKYNIIDLTEHQSAAVIKHIMEGLELKIDEKSNELWVSSLAYRGESGTIGTEIIIVNTHCLNHHPFFLQEKYVQCMVQCGEYVWMGSRTNTSGTIEIFKTHTHEHVHSINLCTRSLVTCMTSYQDTVYLGTIKGFCFCFKLDELLNGLDGIDIKLSEHPINDIICVTTKGTLLWVSNSRSIHFLCPNTLSHQGSTEQMCDSDVGKLSASPPEFCRVWSAHLGSTILTAWDTTSRSQLFELNVEPHLAGMETFCTKKDMAISTIVAALDTVWVGTASGHLLVFHDQQLLMKFRPYTENIRFLTCIPSNNSGRCTVASEGGKFKSLIEHLEANHILKQQSGGKSNQEKASTIIFWEAHLAKTIKQIKLIKENSPNLYDNHTKLQEIIQCGEFNDMS